MVYFKVFSLGFTMLDDTIFIVENQGFNDKPENIMAAFCRGLFNPEQDIYYRPLFLVDFIIESKLFGLNPAGYHLTNLIYHILSVLLLFEFLSKTRISTSAALFLALLFAVHPVLSQAVAWIPGRNDSILMILFLSGIILTRKYMLTGKWYYLALAWLTFVLSLFTKESAIIIPLVSFPVYILIFKASRIRWLPVLVSWIIAIMLYFVIRSKATLLQGNLDTVELLKNALVRWPVILQYLGKIFFPVNLSVFPAIKETSVWWGVAALVILSGIIVLSRSMLKVITLIGLLWFLLFLFPVLLVPPYLNDQTFEHRLYIPIAGILLVLSQTFIFTGYPENPNGHIKPNLFLISKLTGNRTLKLYGGVLILLVCSAITYNRIGHYSDPVAFWGQAVKDNPSSSYANMMFGLRQTDTLEMKKYFLKAYQLNPEEKMINYLLGKIALDEGSIEEARKHFLSEARVSKIPDNFFGLANAYFMKNLMDSAAWALGRVIDLDPYHQQANHNLVLLYLQMNRIVSADSVKELMRMKGLEVP